jgi:hypothetical protein
MSDPKKLDFGIKSSEYIFDFGLFIGNFLE